MAKVVQKVPDFMEHFSEGVLQMLKEHSTVMVNKTDVKYFKEFLTDRKKWRYPRVSIDTFLDDERYLGIGKFVYPKVREMCKNIIEKKYAEAVIVAGIGAGKTTVAEILACYATHVLLCMRNPHASYYLAKDKPITIMNMGTTATQALENCFAGIRNLMLKSQWFSRFNPKILSTSIRYVNANILLVSGNSKSTTPLGYNIFYAVLDEAAFYLDNENTQIAEEIYNALQRRIVSRFGNDGLVVMISSPRYEGDFIMTKLEEAKKFPELIFSSQIPTWKTKPIKQADMANKFYFNSRTGLIDEAPDLSKKQDICFVEDLFVPTKTLWEIPGEYKKSFVQDPDKAKRDFAALPSMTIEAYMAHPEIIKEMFDDSIETPVKKGGGYKFAELPLRTNYYIHIDLALNKKNKGDHAGFAMAHFEGWEENAYTGERQKKIVVDLAERISAGVTGEINFDDVRNRVYALKKMGYTIRLVTLDQFQSADTLQILRSRGIRAEYLSVDRTIEPYNTLKELIYSKRVKCHKMDFLFDELQRLEITKANKIDHPPGGSKDVSDAVCGAVYNALEHSGGELGIVQTDTEKVSMNNSVGVKRQKEIEAKEEHYRQLQEMLDAGLIQ